jgi:hypothetical protein
LLVWQGNEGLGSVSPRLDSEIGSTTILVFGRYHSSWRDRQPWPLTLAPAVPASKPSSHGPLWCCRRLLSCWGTEITRLSLFHGYLSEQPETPSPVYVEKDWWVVTQKSIYSPCLGSPVHDSIQGITAAPFLGSPSGA